MFTGDFEISCNSSPNVLFPQSKFDELRKLERSTNNSQKLSSQQKMQCYVKAVQAVLASLVDSVRSLHIPKVWDDIR